MSGKAKTKNNETINIGDWVEFKADIEQCGKVINIQGSGKNAELTLENTDGFDGDYIGGETITYIEARRCFLWVAKLPNREVHYD